MDGFIIYSVVGKLLPSADFGSLYKMKNIRRCYGVSLFVLILFGILCVLFVLVLIYENIK